MTPLIVILAGIGLLMLFGGGIALVTSGRDVDERLEQYVGAVGLSPEEVVIDAQQPELADRLDEALAGRGFFAGMKTRLARADARLRVSEYIAIQLVSAVLTGGIFYLLFGRDMLMFFVGLIIGVMIPRIAIGIKASRRIRAFESQLSDTLNLWVNALRSGYSVLQGMEAIATELPAPTSQEFERIVQEVRLGLTLGQAMANMLRRVPSEDLDLVVTAVNIQREVGGNLTEILDNISFTIRERVRIKGEIRTLTAQGRLTGLVITLLPVGLAGILYAINPEYGGQLVVREDPLLFNTIPCGWLVLGAGAIMIIAGGLIVRKIVDIEV